ncbi:MAG TPA: NADH-quinone oxidoreductase subunit A [Candidatus Latescibacteria bacterium]|nr:NADH-quinone oxidoreductase subunit A [Candidatus Latescibacterota bacterium]HRU24712.1 NADH-quinone oxidoreductase subunit A [Candidatus Latescibacterota bacterium]
MQVTHITTEQTWHGGIMYPSYIPLFYMLILALVAAGSMLVGVHILGPRRHTYVKNSIPYESGLDPVAEGRMRFDVKFYLVAILFVVFDLEVVYFYPWAMVFRTLLNEGMTAFYAMLVFTLTLVVGLVYEWKKGALDWK